MAPVTIVDEEWFLYCYIVAEQARESLKVCLNIFYTCFDNRQPATGTGAGSDKNSIYSAWMQKAWNMITKKQNTIRSNGSNKFIRSFSTTSINRPPAEANRKASIRKEAPSISKILLTHSFFIGKPFLTRPFEKHLPMKPWQKSNHRRGISCGFLRTVGGRDLRDFGCADGMGLEVSSSFFFICFKYEFFWKVRVNFENTHLRRTWTDDDISLKLGVPNRLIYEGLSRVGILDMWYLTHEASRSERWPVS